MRDVAMWWLRREGDIQTMHSLMAGLFTITASHSWHQHGVHCMHCLPKGCGSLHLLLHLARCVTYSAAESHCGSMLYAASCSWPGQLARSVRTTLHVPDTTQVGTIIVAWQVPDMTQIIRF